MYVISGTEQYFCLNVCLGGYEGFLRAHISPERGLTLKYFTQKDVF